MLPIILTKDSAIVTQVERQVRDLIENGRLAPGARMPSVRRLAKDLGISTFTVVNAYDRLAASAYIRARQRAGFYVVEKQLDHVEEKSVSTLPIGPSWLFRALHDSSGTIKAGAGVLPLDWFDEEALKRCARSALRLSGKSFGEYPQVLGYRPLRELIALKLIETGITAQADQILLTSGASHALDLVLRTLVRPGDTILVEDPGYYALYSYLKMHDINFVAIPRSREGLDLDALERAIREHKARVIVLNSLLHNPTGATLQPINAHKILGLAERHNLTIVEDDIYGDFYKGRAFRIANLDQLERVVYLSSFSKTISANLRLGYVAAHTDILARLAERKQATCLATSEISERIAAELLASGEYRRQMARIRERLAAKQTGVVARLADAGFSVSEEPEGGFFLWACMKDGRSSDHLAEAALRQRLVLAPGSLFSSTATPSAWVRFNIAVCDSVLFEERLAACLTDIGYMRP
ncbi:PLP-dependent aminotransferase family protein [Sphingomonas sp.]|uniref:aminotransferase-like domain-containing protein n=1 Tax=Sphingomonas sp. TaxID=28214 RepID=UPI000DB1CCF0|nr:PLP-dependent aminotransferase family protein [Sphingomonas sp.]PZU10763.1 MAG: hypothetical protein DI605_03725 [Sphingomonas sp.]